MDALELTRALVALETPTGSEAPATDFLDAALEPGRLQVVRQPVSAGRDNLYAYREPPALVFSTHLDTVPPYVPLSEDAESIHGRGSCDAKGLAAAMVAAAEQLASAGRAAHRAALRGRRGERIGWGPGRRRASDPRGRFLINGEPTENRLSIGQKGSLRVDLEASGRAAHSAYPDEGVSAIAALLDTIERIRRMPLPTDPLLGQSTLNSGSHQRRRGSQRHSAGRERAAPDPDRGADRADSKQPSGRCCAPGVSPSDFRVELPLLQGRSGARRAGRRRW